MNSLQSVARPISSAPAPRASARRLYEALLGEHGTQPGSIDEVTQSASSAYLRACLAQVDAMSADDAHGLPTELRAWPAWFDETRERTEAAYRDYLAERRAGAPRRFFQNRSHALSFLRAVAPTKLVDGAWLYGVLARVDDARLAPLVRTYLDELGDGSPSANHVSLYRALLVDNDCDGRLDQLDDDLYTQGAIQLSLAHHGDRFLPEVIGFNLGYEQLPLHLPITAYELDELSIDPHYFRLHVTIDNASTGHAQKALQAAFACLPRIGDRDAFFQRIRRGYLLNELGVGTDEAIARFDLDGELVAVLAEQGRIGGPMHSDRCRVAGRPVADWLASPGEIPAMLDGLVDMGWIRRGAPPEESRFWRALHDERGPMFGVFDGHASQLLRDWIVDGAPDVPKARPRNAWLAEPARNVAPRTGRVASVVTLIRRHLDTALASRPDDADIRALAERLARVRKRATALVVLRGFLSPANHTAPAGLLATRLFAALVPS